MPCPLLWPYNKVLKPDIQSIISSTINGCNLLSLILAKLLHLDIRCKNIFALPIVIALTALFGKKNALKRVCFYVKTGKNWLAAGGYAPTPP